MKKYGKKKAKLKKAKLEQALEKLEAKVNGRKKRGLPFEDLLYQIRQVKYGIQRQVERINEAPPTP